MRLNKLELIIVFAGVGSSMSFHFIGSFYFYSGAFMLEFHYGRPQRALFPLMWGCILLIVGLVIALIVGKMLKGKYLAGFSMAYLTISTLSIHLIFSKAYPNRISAFLPHILFSNSTLCIAFFIGYFRKKRSPKRLNEREYPV